MTYADMQLLAVAQSSSWDEVEQLWAEIKRTRTWFASHRWVITPDTVFKSCVHLPFPPAVFGGIADPENNFDRLHELARACGWERQDELMYRREGSDP